MSTDAYKSLTAQFAKNVDLLAQQKYNRLLPAVRVETVEGEKAFFDQIGITAARTRSTRHSDTPLMNTPHKRRMVTLADYDWADLLDAEDLRKSSTDPTTAYADAAAAAISRATDQVIIDAATAEARTGKDGETATPYLSANVVGVTVGNGGAGDVGLNVEKLRVAKEILDAAEAEEDDRYCIVNAKQLRNLLAETETTSADYNTVRTLVNGELNSFLGFKFLRSERLGTDDAGDHKVLFWQKRGMLFAQAGADKSKITERDDKNFATQVFYSRTMGATRMQEEIVGYIACDPS